MSRGVRAALSFVQMMFLCLQVPIAPEAVLSDPYIIEHPENKWVAKNEPVSLTCKVEGKPPPLITWYRNGQPVITSSDDPESERMILPNGFLVIPRVSSSKSGRSDVGVYYCNATNPSTGNWVISRNATLDIAVLRDEFQEHPQDTKVLVGTDTKIKCKPPKGEPDPRTKWKKDGQTLEITGRIFVDEADGTLNILETKIDDSGRYACIAYNAAGDKESRVALVTVREKPQIVTTPRDVQVKENEDVMFECVATGEPQPDVTWSRAEGLLSPQKAVHLPGRGLKLTRVQMTDEDVYKCTAQNEVGSVEVEARLVVQSPPAFLVSPQDKVVGIGREVQLSCLVTGNPQPAIFWKKENIKTLMLQGESYGPFSVLKDGSLVIMSAIVEDSGEYTCQALSTAGAALSKARLTVKETYNKLPPIITTVPQNQTLPIEGNATLPCAAIGDPAPSILWFRKDRVVLPTDPRFTISDTGSLHIEDLRRSDSGVYTCKASSESGDTTWSAYLNVPQTRGDRVFRGAPQPSAYPGPPSRPQVSEVTETSARVSWKRGSNFGLNPDVNFILQAFCFSEGPGWVTVASGIQNTSLVLSDLKPNSFYSFIVRANNSIGIGPPSSPSLTEKTKDFKRSSLLPNNNNNLPTIIDSHSIGHFNATSVNVSWSVATAQRQSRQRFDGILIRCHFVKYMVSELEDHGGSYEDHPDSESHQAKSQQQQQQHQLESGNSASPALVTEYIYSPAISHYFITGLRKFALYELSIQPFLRGAAPNEPGFAAIVERFNTPEDVPSTPPLRIQAFLLNNNSFLRLSWKPPLIQDLNGKLTGYKVHVSSTDAKYSREMMVNASVDSIEVYNLVRNVEYKIQLQATNRAGDGPKSPYIHPKPLTDDSITMDRDNYLDFQHSNQQKHLYNETWFLGVVFAFIGCIIWLSLCVFCVLWYKKRKSVTSVTQGQDKDTEVRRMIASTNQRQFFQEPISQQMSDSGGSKKNPLLRYHHHHHQQQTAGNEQTTNLCHNCNNTLMTSCCYNESISDGECGRQQQLQQQQQQQQHHQQQQHSPVMNHTYYTLENPPSQQQYNHLTTTNNTTPVVHVNNSSMAMNRQLPTSHSGTFLNSGYPPSYHSEIHPSSPVMGNYNFSHPNCANANNNNNYNSRSFRPIPQDRDSFIQHSSDEEIKLATMMATAFQPPILYIPPPPPVEDDQIFDFKSGRNDSDPSYYNELPGIANNYATAAVTSTVKAQIMDYQIPQQRHATEGSLMNPFYDSQQSYQWQSELANSRDSDYDDDTETYNGTTNEDGHRSSSDEVSSIEEDTRFITDNRSRGKKKQAKNCELLNHDNKKRRDYDAGTEIGESFKLPIERCSDDIPRNILKPLNEEPAKAQ